MLQCAGVKSKVSKYFLITLYEGLSVSPVIVRKLGPPLLAGESTSSGEHFPSVVFSFTHDALSDIDFTTATKQKNNQSNNSSTDMSH